MDDAKHALIQGCVAMQSAVQTLLNVPERMNDMLAKRIQDGMDASVRVAWHLLLFSLQLVHSAIADFVKKYFGTLLCIIDLIIKLTVSAVQLVTEEAIATINTSIQQAIVELDLGLQVISHWILTDGQGALGTVAQALGTGWTAVNATVLDLPELRQHLQSLSVLLTIPNSLSLSLQALSTPTTHIFLNQILQMIAEPFVVVERILNQTMGNVSFPAINWQVRLPNLNMPNVCEDSLNLDWMDAAINYLLTPIKWMIAIVILAMLGCMVASVYIGRWKLHSSSTPTDRMVVKVYSILHLSPDEHPRFQAYLRFMAHTASWVCFWTGIFGLVMIEIQLATLSSLVKLLEPDAWAKSLAQPLVDLSTSVVERANETVQTMNQELGDMETSTNHLLSGWLDDSLGLINSSLSNALQVAMDGMDTMFEPVPFLKTAVAEFLHCTLLNSWFSGIKVPTLSFPRIDAVEVLLWMQMDLTNFTLGLTPERILAPYRAKLKQDQAFYIILVCLGMAVPFMALFLFCLPQKRKQPIDDLPPSPVSLLKKRPIK
jgi:hypothetical protein